MCFAKRKQKKITKILHLFPSWVFDMKKKEKKRSFQGPDRYTYIYLNIAEQLSLERIE
jgi:hypothetical protein